MTLRKNTENNLLDGCYLLFEEYLWEKNISLSPKTVPRIGQSFEEIQRRGKLVKNFKTFWINIKTIIEFCFCIM